MDTAVQTKMGRMPMPVLPAETITKKRRGWIRGLDRKVASAKLVAEIELRELKRKDAAEQIGCLESSLSEWCAGKTWPRRDMEQKLAAWWGYETYAQVLSLAFTDEVAANSRVPESEATLPDWLSAKLDEIDAQRRAQGTVSSVWAPMPQVQIGEDEAHERVQQALVDRMQQAFSDFDADMKRIAEQEARQRKVAMLAVGGVALAVGAVMLGLKLWGLI